MNKYLLPLLTTSVALFSIPTIVCAQAYQPSNSKPIADSSFNTQVSSNGNNFDITGGLSKGQTLFHSFIDFSIPSGTTVNFNPQGKRDIITRVTGVSLSDINGMLNSNGANFFLINPNGIVFGPNAQLNVGQAFVASTANSIDLVAAGGGAISFGINNSNGDALLRIAPDVTFNVSRFNLGGGQGAINNFGKLENYNPNPYIGLIGGNIRLDGRDGNGKIVAPTGRVDLGGLNAAGTVTIDNQGLVFEGNATRSDVSILNGASVYVFANQQLGTVNTFINNATSPGSTINIGANNLRIINDKSTSNTTQSYLGAGLATNSGINTGTTGDINIQTTGQVSLDNATIFNLVESGADGKIGNIKISTNSLSLNNNSEINSLINIGGKGDTGNVQIDTNGDITIFGTTDPTLIQSGIFGASTISNNIKGTGTAGKILIDTKGDISLANRGSIINSIDVINQDNAGNIITGEALTGNHQGISIINAKNLSLTNNSNIQASNYSGKGNPGSVDIKITGDLNISGTVNAAKFKDKPTYQLASGIGSAVSGTGNSGNININAKSLSMADISTIQTNTYSGIGNAGNVKIATTGDINISGTNDPALLTGEERQSLSTIGSATASTGQAGSITIDTRGKLSLTNRGGIYNSIDRTGVGSGQLINISTADLSLKNLSLIESANVGGQGNAGSIKIQTKGTVEVASKSVVRSSSNGTGEAANVSINSDRVILNDGSIEAKASSAKGGNIDLTLRDQLLMRNNSRINTDSDSNGKNGSGGNITINSPLIVATPTNNDITANAYQGNGGKVNIFSQGLFGIDKRAQGSNLTNDITASSDGGNSGIVDIKTPGTDPGKDSTELPNVPTDASNQISQACSASNRDHKLTVTGRGGLPPNANDPLTSDVVWQDARAASSQPAISSATTHPAKLAPPAVGWIFNGKGKVTLVAATTPGQPTQTTVVCPNLVKK